MEPHVSVIVAIFNAEKWLPRCLDSLVSQTLESLEILLIDDGSTDSSGQICEEYARKDCRIRVIHQTNKGVSATRQVGITHSTGDYFIFLDADDYVCSHAYQLLYDIAIKKKADIVCTNYYRIESSGISPVNSVKPHYTLESKLKEIIFHQNGYLWRHLISRDLILRYPIEFPLEMNFGEDLFYLTGLLSSCKDKGYSIRIASCKENLIYYDKSANPQSLTRVNAQKRFWARFHWFESVYNQINLDKTGISSLFRRLVDDSFASLWNNSIPAQDLCSALKPYSAPIRQFAPLSPQKYLVLLLCDGEYERARRLKYLASFRVGLDKLHQVISQFHRRTSSSVI